jgi:hypothetical protein
MANTLPFHTVKPGTPYAFHNNDACEIAKRVEPRYWRAGDDGGKRPLCENCARLAAAGK